MSGDADWWSSRGDRSASLALRLYTWLLRVSPRADREAFGEEMGQVFADRLRARRSSKRPRLASFYAREFLAVAWLGLRARWATRNRRGAHKRGALPDHREIRWAVRRLRRQPVLALTVIATLTIAIGANTVVFSLVNAIVFDPLPYEDPDRLAVVWTRYEKIVDAKGVPSMAVPDFFDYRDRTRALQGIAAGFCTPTALTGADGEPIQANRVGVTANFFEVLGVAPALGRSFSANEDRPADPRVALLSHNLWQTRFGSSPSVLGRTIELGGESHEIIGVLPRDFRMWVPPETFVWVPPIDVWTNLRYDRESFPRGRRHLLTLARLTKGASWAQAEAEAAALARWLQTQHAPYEEDGLRLELRPLHGTLVATAKPRLYILWFAGGFVMLVACANVGGLLLARGVKRRGEVALRVALGARRRQLMGSLVVEDALLALFGCLGGLALASALLRAVIAAGLPSLPRLEEVQLDALVVFYTAAVTIVALFFFGVVPALVVTTTDPRGWLASLSGRNAGDARSHRLLSTIAVSQVALALVVLLGATLVGRSLLNLLAVRPGFDVGHAVTFHLPAWERYHDPNDPEAMTRFYESLEERLRSIPGVEAVGGSNTLPLSGGGTGWDFEYGSARGRVDLRAVTPGYFDALGTRLLAGRHFDRRDGTGETRVAIIDASLASQLRGARKAVGTSFRLGSHETRVVGVVEHLYSSDLRVVLQPQVYVPQRRMGWQVKIAVRGETPASLLPAIRKEVAALDDRLPIAELRLVDDLVADALKPARLVALTLSVFAVVALLLACLGLYGLLTYVLEQRRREVGVRLALGATSRDIVTWFVGKGMRLVASGVVAGIGIAALIAPSLRAVLFGVAPFDGPSVTLASLIVAVLAGASCVWSVRRVHDVTPVEILREE